MKKFSNGLIVLLSISSAFVRSSGQQAYKTDLYYDNTYKRDATPLHFFANSYHVRPEPFTRLAQRILSKPREVTRLLKHALKNPFVMHKLAHTPFSITCLIQPELARRINPQLVEQYQTAFLRSEETPFHERRALLFNLLIRYREIHKHYTDIIPLIDELSDSPFKKHAHKTLAIIKKRQNSSWLGNKLFSTYAPTG